MIYPHALKRLFCYIKSLFANPYEVSPDIVARQIRWGRYSTNKSKPSMRDYAVDYKEYLASEHWKTVRYAVRSRDALVCKKCGTYTPYGEVHHMTYDGVGREMDNLFQLVYVCPTCHKEIHSRCKYEPWW